MKKILLGTLLASLTAVSAMAEIQFASYNVGTECEIIVSQKDFFGTGEERLVVELGGSRVSPWGAFLTQSLEVVAEQLAQSNYITLDNAAGMGAYLAAEVYFDKSGAVSEFYVQEMAPNGKPNGPTLACDKITRTN